MFGIGLVEIFAIIFVFGSPAVVIFFLARYWHIQTMEMIRLGIKPNMYTPAYPGKKSLLWGLLLSFLGIAALISTFIDSHSDPDFMSFGLLVLGAGVALLVYWKLTASERERERRLYEERFAAETASSSKATPQPSCPEAESPAPESDGQAM